MKFRLLLAALLLVPACRGEVPRAPDDAIVAALKDHRRVIALEGGRNFRDLGGYATADGQRVKWRLLYRSGTPTHLTDADAAKLRALGIRMVCDLRDTGERAREPNRWAPQGDVPYWARDYSLQMAGVMAALKADDASAAKSRAAMLDDYRAMPEAQAEGLAAIFRNLAAGAVPLAFNCSAGKDRTGLASALILHALGVPRATILADYALTDRIVDYRAALRADAATSPTSAALVKLPWEVVQPLMASDPAYLQAAFAAMAQRHGSVDGYLEQRLGVTPAMRAAMRARLLES